MSIRAHAARLDLGTRVSLYDIDLTELGGGIQRFTPMNQVLGSRGVSRITSPGRASIRRNYALPTNTARAIYVKMVIRRENAPAWFSIIGFTSGALVSAKSFDPAGVRAAVNRTIPAGMNAPTLVQYIAQGDYVTIGVSIVVSGTNYIDGIYLMPNGGGAGNNWAGNSTVVTGARLDILSFEIWEEPTLNNLRKLSDGTDYTNAQYLVEANIPADEVVAPLRWRGNLYTALPVRAEGFEVVGGGAYPRPKITLSNALGVGTTLVKEFNDLLGARVTRWRTFSRFLDDGVSPDPNAHLPTDIYYVDLKSRHTKSEIEWELASVLDQKGVMLPGRQVLRHGCQLQYRTYSGGAFNYQNVSCPYVGTRYFNERNEPVQNPANDRCSQQLNGCLLRFTGNAVPFGGFPMVGRITR